MKNEIIANTKNIVFYKKDSGNISHKTAIEKASSEYEKFGIKQDQEYISSMDEMYKSV